MRVNLYSPIQNSYYPKILARHWVSLLAQEFLVQPETAARWLWDPDCHEFVQEFLAAQGWKLARYKTPEVDGKIFSFGFVIDDDCPMLTQFKLSHS